MSEFHVIARTLRSKQPAATIVIGLLCSLFFVSSVAYALIDQTLFGPKRYDRLKGKPTVYTDAFDGCNPATQGILRVTNGDSKKTRIKSARIYVNGSKVASEKDFKHKIPSFEKIISIKEQNNLKVILKSGHHGYFDTLAKYQRDQAGAEEELARLKALKDELTAASPLVSAAKIENFLKEVHDLKKSQNDREARLDKIATSLDDGDADDEDDDADDDTDDGNELDSGWAGKEREQHEQYRKELKDAVRECEKARADLDKTPKSKRGKDHDTKDEALKGIAKQLKEIDRAVERLLDKLAEISENIEKTRKKGPSFLIIEILGKGCDGTPPVISNPAPPDGSFLNTGVPAITAQYADDAKGTGIDITSVRVTVNGTDVTSSANVTQTGVSYTPASNLPEGGHTILVSVSDQAHNAASLTWHFTTDTVAPVVKITSPQHNQDVNTPTITLSGSIDDPTATVTVNNTIAAVSVNTFALSDLALSEGQNTITVAAKDPVGNIGKDSITINLDSIAPDPPVITQPGTPVNVGSITLNGAAEALSIVKIYAGQGSAALIGTVPADAQGSFSLSGVTLTEGGNAFTATATDATGNTGNLSTPVSVTLDTAAPIVTITAPQAEAWFKTPSITVTGTVNEPVTAVTVNGMPATITGTGFSLAGVQLTEGQNTITVVATDLADNHGTGSAAVMLDTLAPVITITTPVNGSFINTPKITVSGHIIELNPLEEIRVNGSLVPYSTGDFSLPDVALTEGSNTITVQAKDKAGNESSASVTLTLDTIAPEITISSPAPGLLTRTAQIAVSGTVSETNTTVTVNSTAALVSGQTYSVLYTLSEEQNSLVASATDRAGNTGTASITVTLDTTRPSPPVITPLATPSPTPVVVVNGTSEPLSTVHVYMASGQTAAVLAGTVTADAQGSFSLADVALAEGITTFTATATDSLGNTSDTSVPVSVEKDTTPPVITVASPSNNSYTSIATVPVNGSLDDATAKLMIKGAAVALDGMNFETTVTITEGLNSILFTAEDPSANTSSETLFITLDTIAPAVAITSPLNNALVTSSQVSVSGTVNEVVASVSVNGTSALVSGSSYSLPSYTLTEGQNTITAEAIDRAGNKGSASVNITLDSIAPAVSLSAPAQAAAGTNVTLTLGASDAGGLRLVEVIADNAVLWSYTLNAEYNTSNSISFTLSPDLAPGSVVNLQARAHDTAGNIGTTPAGIQINQGPSGPGYIQGEVYDDSKGLRLAGAAASISSMNPTASVAELATQDDGGYFTEAPKGDYLVTLSKTGFTSVERIVAVKPEKKTIALDARLTPVNTAQNLIDSAGGTIQAGVGGQPVPPAGGAGAGNVELIIPANAVAGQTDIRVTPISNQGLAGSLPIGWSPVAAVDISTAGPGSQGQGSPLDFNVAATLKVALVSSPAITASSPVAFVSYNAGTHQWIVQDPGTVSADGTFVTAFVSSTGQYALVLPDSSAFAVPGSPLPPLGSSISALSTSPTGTGRVVPSSAPPSIGLKAVGEVILSPSPLGGEGGGEGGLSSGMIVNATVTERFDLFSGDAVAPSDYVQDLVLYRYPCSTNFNPNSAFSIPNSSDAGSTFPVTPSHEYTIADLMMGKVGISITLPEPDASGTLVGIDGGRILDTDGTVISIPANALAKTVPIQTKTVPASTMTGIVGPDFNLLRAVDVNLTGQTLTSSAELSIPLPVGFNANLPVVIARAIDVRGAQKLKLVAIARLSGSLITSGLNGVSGLNGIVTSGQYFFLQAKAPLGFVKGTVTSSSGAPASAALATISTCSLVDLTNTTGSYLVASTVASFSVAATDIYKNDTGTGSGAIATANQTVALDIAIMVTPPNVLSLTPGDNAANVEPNAAIVVTFSEPVDKGTLTAANITLKDSAGTVVDGTFSVNPESTVVTLYPSTLLASEAQYSLTVSRNIKDLQGYTMTGDVTATFTTKDTTPPPMPAAGSITATFPDADGYVTITATQGSAEAGGTVLIINDNTGEIVAITPNSNGSFTGKIMAQLGDDIKLVSMDAAGNQTLISYIAMKSPDGKHLVSAKGGIVEGEGGTKLIIPEGALDGPTVIKITPVTQDQLPHPVPEKAGFLAAVNIDTGGATFQKPVKLSVPAPANLSEMPEGSMPFVSQPSELVNADGTIEKVYVIHDSAKVIDGRLTTASPPFAGILVGGFFVFEFPYFTVGIVDGYTYRDMDGNSGYLPENGDLPVKNAVIRVPASWEHVVYSRASGFYAAFAELMVNVPGYPDKVLNITAIHPLTMQRVNTSAVLSEPPYNIAHLLNIKLSDRNSVPPDTAAPSITMNVKVVPGQTIPGQTVPPQFVAGTIPIGTDLEVPVSVADQEIASVTLTIKYKTPDMPAAQEYSVLLDQTGSTFETYVSADNPVAITRNTYAPNFSSVSPSFGPGSPITGNPAAYFKPGVAGTYTLVVEAWDGAGHKSTKNLTVRAVTAGAQPDSIDGPPAVDEIVPGDGAKEIMITMPIMVTFSEPVNPETVNENTFKLIDLSTNLPVSALRYTSIEGGRMRATLQPNSNLFYDREYEIVLTQDILDSNANDSAAAMAPHSPYMALDREYHARFKTKVPQAFDLPQEQQFEAGTASVGGIALYTVDGRTFAYISANENGWRSVDVTDPTNPFVVWTKNLSTPAVSWSFRGVAVNPDTRILGITENIRWNYAGGSMFGYIRFYDLAADPEKPGDHWLGQARLAESYSGVPGKVAISGNYAFVATSSVGLQVVDIDASRVFDSAEPGKAIVGGFDTVNYECDPTATEYARGCGSPVDIDVFKGGKALLTTTKGYLLVLDVNMPQFPQLMTKFTAQSPGAQFGYKNARQVSLAEEYAFTEPETGDSRVIDLAVVSSAYPVGNVFTMDLTDPYNPTVLGILKDQQGSVLNDIFVQDITIGKTAGLAYLTVGYRVYVIDIKNPKDPRLLNIIDMVPDANGDLMQMGYNTALVEKDGWVYLVNQKKGLRVLDLDPVYLKWYCEEGEFSSVSKKFCNDYYPSLASYLTNNSVKGKNIILQGFDANFGLLDTPAKVKLTRITVSGTNSDISRVKVFPKGASSPCTAAQIGDGSCITTFNKGVALFSVATDQGFNATDSPYIKLRFEADLSGFSWWQQVLLQTSMIPGFTSMDAYITEVQLRVRDNSNISMEEVINGNAIFAYDNGESNGRLDFINGERGFYFVQEMLNQVVPRKRTVPNTFRLVPEEGRFDVATETTIKTFREKFSDAIGLNADGRRIGNTRANFSTDSNGNVKYEGSVTPLADDTYVNDNTTDTFRKLMKDYNRRSTPAESATWLHRIIEKETLVGAVSRVPLSTLPTTQLTIVNADIFVNDAVLNTRKDTGLYELYKNVVERFVNGMIEEAEYYSGDRGDPGTTAPTDQWTARTGAGPSEHGRGMSYCYGSNDSISDFNSNVSTCRAPSSEQTQGYFTFTSDGGWVLHNGNRDFIATSTTVDANYQGNVNDSGCGMPGPKKYPGLYKWEWMVRGTNPAYYKREVYGEPVLPAVEFPQFNPRYWSGIQCNGLVGRAIQKSLENFSIISGSDYMVQLADIYNGNSIVSFDSPSALDNWGSSTYFRTNIDTVHHETVMTYYMPGNLVDTVKKLHKGDLVHYANHMSIVHSDRPEKCMSTTCQYKYEIIHAYGSSPYRPLNDGGQVQDPVFSRKVIKTKQNIGSNPTGFGRIKLWD